MTAIQEDVLLDSETVINTVCGSMQVSAQKLCEHITFLLNTGGAPI